jgi:hypothetical protein
MFGGYPDDKLRRILAILYFHADAPQIDSRQYRGIRRVIREELVKGFIVKKIDYLEQAVGAFEYDIVVNLDIGDKQFIGSGSERRKGKKHSSQQ